jgi:hypothetical protein
MRYDFTEDPSSKNAVNKWNGGYDIYLKTAYDYTRWGGPLGMYEPLLFLQNDVLIYRYGPIGPFGPLGKYGNIPNRFMGSTSPSLTVCRADFSLI